MTISINTNITNPAECEEKGLLHISSGNLNKYIHYVKQHRRSSEEQR